MGSSRPAPGNPNAVPDEVISLENLPQEQVAEQQYISPTLTGSVKR